LRIYKLIMVSTIYNYEEKPTDPIYKPAELVEVGFDLIKKLKSPSSILPQGRRFGFPPLGGTMGGDNQRN